MVEILDGNDEGMACDAGQAPLPSLQLAHKAAAGPRCLHRAHGRRRCRPWLGDSAGRNADGQRIDRRRRSPLGKYEVRLVVSDVDAVAGIVEKREQEEPEERSIEIASPEFLDMAGLRVPKGLGVKFEHQVARRRKVGPVPKHAKPRMEALLGLGPYIEEAR